MQRYINFRQLAYKNLKKRKKVSFLLIYLILFAYFCRKVFIFKQISS